MIVTYQGGVDGHLADVVRQLSVYLQPGTRRRLRAERARPAPQQLEHKPPDSFTTVLLCTYYLVYVV